MLYVTVDTAADSRFILLGVDYEPWNFSKEGSYTEWSAQGLICAGCGIVLKLTEAREKLVGKEVGHVKAEGSGKRIGA